MMKENMENPDLIFDGKTAGEILRAARTTGRKKREIQTIARGLCIREEFLEALENGEYHKIPELVYILGFARNYAIELELDPDVIIQKIKYELGIIKDETAESDDAPAAEIPVAAAEAIYAGSQKTPAFVEFLTRFWKYILGAVVVVGAAATLMFAMRPKVSERPAGAVDAPQVEQPAPQSAPTFKLPVRETFGNENKATATVVLQATAETWLRVEDTRGETLFSRVLTAGDLYFVPASGSPRATIGNAGGLDVWVNGRPMPKIGADHVRKSGVLLTPAALTPAPTPQPTE